MKTAISKTNPRLQTLEKHISKCAEEIQKNGLEIGRSLCEIRDQELWVGKYDSWDKYLKDRAKELVGKSFSQAANLIQAAEIQKRLPESIQSIGLNPTHLKELGRLAPSRNGNPKHRDYGQIRKPDVERVIKRATENADSETLTVNDIRKAVDNALGIDRGKQAKERNAEIRKSLEQVRENDRKRQEHDRKLEQIEKERDEYRRQLWVYLTDANQKMDDWIKILDEVPAEAWVFLDKEHPGIADAFMRNAQELAALIPNAKARPTPAGKITA